jgi:hypothetical protein
VRSPRNGPPIQSRRNKSAFRRSRCAGSQFEKDPIGVGMDCTAQRLGGDSCECLGMDARTFPRVCWQYQTPTDNPILSTRMVLHGCSANLLWGTSLGVALPRFSVGDPKTSSFNMVFAGSSASSAQDTGLKSRCGENLALQPRSLKSSHFGLQLVSCSGFCILSIGEENSKMVNWRGVDPGGTHWKKKHATTC